MEAYVTGITAYILPEFDRMMEQPQNNPYHKYNVGVHSMEAVKVIEPTTVCRWAALCFMMWESRNVILWMKMVSTISMDIMRRG